MSLSIFPVFAGSLFLRIPQEPANTPQNQKLNEYFEKFTDHFVNQESWEKQTPDLWRTLLQPKVSLEVEAESRCHNLLLLGPSGVYAFTSATCFAR